MDRYITRENIKRFKARLATLPDGEERLTLQRLLGIEEARLRTLAPGGAGEEADLKGCEEDGERPPRT